MRSPWLEISGETDDGCIDLNVLLYSAASKPIPLELEVWYHGPMSRAEAELLLEDEGDFLVRESKSKAGQYVLSGVQKGQPRHLLLVDPEGKVCIPMSLWRV